MAITVKEALKKLKQRVTTCTIFSNLFKELGGNHAAK